MKMTIVSNGNGKLVASAFENTYEDTSKELIEEDRPSATLVSGPGQVFEEIDVPDEYAKLSPDDLHRELQKYLSREADEAE